MFHVKIVPRRTVETKTKKRPIPAATLSAKIEPVSEDVMSEIKLRPIPNGLYGAYINEDGDAV